jgi:hypothetical protein
VNDKGLAAAWCGWISRAIVARIEYRVNQYYDVLSIRTTCIAAGADLSSADYKTTSKKLSSGAKTGLISMDYAGAEAPAS